MKQTNLNLILGLRDRKKKTVWHLDVQQRKSNVFKARWSAVSTHQRSTPWWCRIVLHVHHRLVNCLKEKCVYRTSFNRRHWLRPWAKSHFQKREGVVSVPWAVTDELWESHGSSAGARLLLRTDTTWRAWMHVYPPPEGCWAKCHGEQHLSWPLS